jgi:sigma-B regulation protein RsbU (phosphoserine phosphatase)
MLINILKQQHEHFSNLAAIWLSAGATAVGIWNNDTLLQQWPEDAAEFLLEQPDLVAPLYINDIFLGEVRVAGMQGIGAGERLLADVRVLAQLIRLEDDLEDVTAELVESQDQLIALYDLARSTRSHLDVRETLEALARTTARLVTVQASFMLIESANNSEMVSQPVSLVEPGILHDLFAQVQKTRKELVLDINTTPDMLPRGIYNLCVIPIPVGGTIIAALGMLNRPDGFTPVAMQLIRAIAGQASGQIENVLLHQESLEQTKLQTEMDLASQAQLHLLPQSPPDVVGLEIYARSRPALHVGGDFYDFIYRPGRPFIFSVGDVAGKGMSAALLMAMSRTAIRSKANFMPKATPEMILSRSNDDLYSDFAQVRKFATVFVGQYEPGQRTLLYTNAGHSPVIYCPRKGSARLLDANGTAMGMIHINSYKNQMLTMNPGDILVVATDGFSEARSPRGEIFGFDRLIKLTERLVHSSAEGIAQGWFETIERFEAGYPQDDDQTLVVIKVKPIEDS